MLFQIPNPEENHWKSQEKQKKRIIIFMRIKAQQSILLDMIGSGSSTDVRWKAGAGYAGTEQKLKIVHLWELRQEHLGDEHHDLMSLACSCCHLINVFSCSAVSELFLEINAKSICIVYFI